MRILGKALAMNLLNPKLTLFFLALPPRFLARLNKAFAEK